MSIMLINARPRFTSKGFGALVPTQRVEFLHQRLVDMTNNEANAWGLFRPVAASTDHWDQQLDDFGNENFPFHTLYAGYYQETSSIPQGHSTNLPKAFSYVGAHHNQCQTYKRPEISSQSYQDPVAEMNSFGNPSLMLGNDYSQWGIGRRNGSFAEFSNTQNGQKNPSYQGLNNADLTSFASTISLAQPQPPYQNNSGANADDIPKISRTSPNTVYRSYSSSTTSIDPQALAYLGSNTQEVLTKNTSWLEQDNDNKDQYHGIYEMAVSQDGLPRASTQQHQEWNDSWHIGGGLSNNWTSKTAVPITVSPKALTLDVPPAPLSSCGSSQGCALSLSDSNAGFSSGDDHSDFSGPETLSIVEPPPAVQRPRHILPDSIPVSQRTVPMLPSNGVVGGKSPKKRPLKPKSGSSNGGKPRPLYPNIASNTKAFLSQDEEHTPPRVHKRIEPKLIAPSVRQPCTEPQPSQAASVAQSMDHRDAKDDFLVRSKLAGMSYKDIRRQGNFTEAESTLRGRFRTLTKHKAARVRKPEWGENDIRLLKRAVRKLAHGSDPSKSRVPWKQVADYIANNGGSYHFGNATCRKRWDELQMSGS